MFVSHDVVNLMANGRIYNKTDHSPCQSKSSIRVPKMGTISDFFLNYFYIPCNVLTQLIVYMATMSLKQLQYFSQKNDCFISGYLPMPVILFAIFFLAWTKLVNFIVHTNVTNALFP